MTCSCCGEKLNVFLNHNSTITKKPIEDYSNLLIKNKMKVISIINTLKLRHLNIKTLPHHKNTKNNKPLKLI